MYARHQNSGAATTNEQHGRQPFATVRIGLVLMAVFAAGLFVWGCDKGDSPEKDAPSGNAQREKSTPDTAELPPGVKIVTVDALAQTPINHAGRVAVKGVVARVFADRGAFILIDPAEVAACGTTECALYSVPVLTPKAEFRGQLPEPEETVVAIGTVQPEGQGYRFVIEEVRRDGQTFLSRLKPAADGSLQILDHLPSTLLAQAEALDLSDEQLEQLKQLHTRYSEAQAALQKKIAHCQAELVELLEQQLVDQGKVSHEKEEITELKEKLAALQKQTETSARAVLTTEQLRKAGG